MIAHENTDISISTIGLLQELTEPSALTETPEAAALIDHLVTLQGLELIVQNLSRLDEKIEGDATGVYNTFAIIENIGIHHISLSPLMFVLSEKLIALILTPVEVRPDSALMISSKTHILTFLLERLSSKSFDSNKLYCSEIFTVLLQSDVAISRMLVDEGGLQGGMDGIDALLQILFQVSFRKRRMLTVIILNAL